MRQADPGGHPEAPGHLLHALDGRLQYGLVLPKGSARLLRERDWVEESVQAAPAWLAEHVRAHRGEIDGPSD